MSKGSANFVKGDPNGEVNYPPFEVQNKIIAAEYQKHEVKPISRISEYPKRIPYNSDKKSFQQKTGRDGFEVYQYTFRIPGDDRNKDAHCVMWDYNIGLVRVTALFKSLNFSKTMPAKVMGANPGLRDVSHSITGGSISAQGYWVPFEAAKAIAARLCYEIRYVLVPLFGPDFVSMCHKPGDPDFQELSIDRSIIRRCKEGAAAIQAQSRESSMVGSPKTPSPYAELPIWPPNKGLRATDVESGYGTDTDRSDMNPSCPGSPTGTGWTPVNKRKVLNLNNFQFPPPAREITSTPWVKASATSSSRASSSKRTYFNEEASDENTLMSTQPLETSQASPKRRKVTPDPTSNMTPEVEAAYTLVQLSLADAKLSVEKKGARRRRASA